MTTRGDPATEWEGLSVAAWREQLDLPEVLVHDTVSSTSDVAAERARAGARAGLLVLAEHQTAGRGRADRSWQAAPGSSILLSFLMRPLPGIAPGALPIRIGLAVAAALRSTTGLDVRVKWPNDLVVPARGKLAGILCEAAGAGAADGFVIAGIGLNVRQQPDDWPDALRGAATSIDACLATRSDRAALLRAVAGALLPLRSAPLAPLSTAELERLNALDLLRGRAIGIGDDPQTVTGAGIAPDGALLIDDGRDVHRVVSATVRLRDPVTSTPRQAP